jgi:hypothetical protein
MCRLSPYFRHPADAVVPASSSDAETKSTSDCQDEAQQCNSGRNRAKLRQTQPKQNPSGDGEANCPHKIVHRTPDPSCPFVDRGFLHPNLRQSVNRGRRQSMAFLPRVTPGVTRFPPTSVAGANSPPRPAADWPCPSRRDWPRPSSPPACAARDPRWRGASTARAAARCRQSAPSSATA